MENRNNEQVIFIKDLLFAALYRWRKILIVALALALALGGWTMYSGIKGLQAQKTGLQQSESEHYLAVEQQVTTLKNNIDSQLTYMNESVLMSLDPYAVYKAVGTVTVKLSEETTEETSEVNSLAKVYSVMLSDAALLTQTAEQTGIAMRYLTELVAFSDGAAVWEPTHTLTVTVSHKDGQTAEKILQVLLENVNSIHAQLTDLGIPHDVDCRQALSVQVDRDLIKLQADERQNLKNLQAVLEEKEKELASLAASGEGIVNLSDAIKKSVIFAVIGAVLGAGVVVCLIWVRHIAGGNVYSARTLNAWTGVRVLGCIAAVQYKNPIDRWLRKLEERAQAQQLPVTVANLRNYCAGEQSLLICADDSSNKEVLEALSNTGVQTWVCGSLSKDVSALEKLPQCSAVLLVVSCGSSKYTDVAKQMAVVKDHKKNLIGCVLLGG